MRYWGMRYIQHTQIFNFMCHCESNYAMYFMCIAFHNLCTYNMKILITRSILHLKTVGIRYVKQQSEEYKHTSLTSLLIHEPHRTVSFKRWQTASFRFNTDWLCALWLALLVPLTPVTFFPLPIMLQGGVFIPIVQINQSCLSNPYFKG